LPISDHFSLIEVFFERLLLLFWGKLAAQVARREALGLWGGLSAV